MVIKELVEQANVTMGELISVMSAQFNTSDWVSL